MKNLLPIIAGCTAVVLTTAAGVYTLGTTAQQIETQQPQVEQVEINNIIDAFEHSATQIENCETDQCVMNSFDELEENLDRLEREFEAESDRIQREFEEDMNELEEKIDRDQREFEQQMEQLDQQMEQLDQQAETLFQF